MISGKFYFYILILCMITISNSEGSTNFISLDNGPWPMYGHDINSTGQSQYAGKGDGVLKWKYDFEGPSGHVSISSDNVIYFVTKNYLNAIDTEGKLLWKKYIQHIVYYCVPTIDSKGTIYVNESKSIYAVTSKGKFKWKYDVGDYLYYSIDVHELWDRSGSNSYGEYTSPEDMAYEMVEDVLESYNREIFRLLDLKMYMEATKYCKGVLKGIHRFDNESSSEFKDWAIDIPGECFSYLEEEFNKRCQNAESLKLLSQFIKKNCSEWT